MKLGIKIGLKSNWQADLEATEPEFCEIWFHSGKIGQYQPLFEFIQKLGIGVGLHFWGVLDDGTLANLAYPNNKILNASRQLVKNTIDCAAQYNAVYVNLHPTGRVLTHVNFEAEEFTPYSPLADLNQTRSILQESLTQQADYARRKNVPLCVESVPPLALGNPWRGKSGSIKPMDIGEFPISEFADVLHTNNLYFSNDFGHTGANIISDNRTSVKNFLFDTTRQLASRTKLLHIGYIIPPYNGIDYHGNLYDAKLQSDAAVPNFTELKQLLGIFKDRSDVYALVEPESDHTGNYKFLKNLVESL